MEFQFDKYKSNLGKGISYGSQIGGLIGSVVPGVGTAIGTLAGGIAGAGFGNLVTLGQTIANPNGSNYKPQTAIFAKYGAELEKQETVLRPDNNLLSFDGPSHAMGGFQYYPKYKNEFVFSDSIGFDSQNKLSLSPKSTFAKMSNKFKSKDPISTNTLSVLKDDNKRMLKMMSMQYGGTPKYYLGGPLTDNEISLAPSPNFQLPTIPNFSLQTNPMNRIKSMSSTLNPLLNSSTPNYNPITQSTNLVSPIKRTYGPSLTRSSVPLNISMNPSMANTKPTFRDVIDNVGRESGQNFGINAAAASQVPGVLYNIAKGLGKATVDDLRLNRQMDDSINLMSNLEYNPEEMYNQVNRQASVARMNVTANNPFFRNAQNQAITNSVANSAAQANLQGQGMNNQLRTQEAQVRAQLGSEERNIQRERDIANLQNKAARNTFLQQAFTDLGSIGKAINEGAIKEAEIKEASTILSQIYPQFAPRIEQIMTKLRNKQELDQEELILFKLISINGN